jgi:putative tryptophan/tyrosine transport system substrate-binding protein
MRRRDFFSVLPTVPVTWSIAARAQPAKQPVVGVLGSASPVAYTERLTAIRQGLAEIGFAEGRTVAMDYRWAEGQLDRLPSLANELVARRVNVLVATGGLQAVHAAMAATNTIPIVFSTDGDPVTQGLVANLNRPSGNATGITVFSGSLTAKRLEVFREIVPKTKLIGVLINATADQAAQQVRDAEESAHSLGLESRVLEVRSEPDFDPVLSAFGKLTDAGLLVSADPLFVGGREKLVAAANRYRIPAIYGRRDFAAAGGLASYGANLAEPYRLMGTYVGRILKGEKVVNLPVAQPTRFELVINKNTAKALDIVLSPSLLAIADEVIE